MYALYSMNARPDMPPKKKKPADSERVQMRVPASWLATIDEWRSKQRPIPNVSEAIRRLVDLGLEKGKRK